VPHLAGGYQFGEGADRVLDRGVGVDPVQVVQVDVVDAEPIKRTVDGPVDVLRPTVHLTVALPAEGDAALGREDHLVPPVRDRAADDPLVLTEAIDVGGVDQRDAEFERAVDRGDRLGLVHRAVNTARLPTVRAAHAHTAQALGRHDQIVTQRVPRLRCS